MKQLSRPISSPCRAEKYPPQLMRFLSSNGGSRSRGRSRSSPMFIRKKNASIETQEPSSPKVTCMGQVRVKPSKQTGSKTGPLGLSKWIKNALFCHSFHGKVKAKLRFFGSCRKTKAREDSSKFGEHKIQESNDDGDENEEGAKIFASSYCSSPPKNALILTRCRSAPYRSSSLACRFWESPLTDNETSEETEIQNRGFKEETEMENRVFKEEVNPTSEKESICSDSDNGSKRDSGTEEKPGCCVEFEEKKLEKTENCEELKTEQKGNNVRPLILTRCKSEPARTGARLDPDISFWKKRRNVSHANALGEQVTCEALNRSCECIATYRKGVETSSRADPSW